jgi:hypothetical protein
MYNPHSMYLLGKSIQADRLKEAEQRRLANLVRSQKAEEPGGNRSLSLGLSLAARTAIVIALAVVLNIAG